MTAIKPRRRGFGLAADLARRTAKRLDLRRGLRTAVGDDLFQHPDALFQLGIAGCILSSLLGGEARLDFQLFSFKAKKRLNDVGQQRSSE